VKGSAVVSSEMKRGKNACDARLAAREERPFVSNEASKNGADLIKHREKGKAL